MHGADKISREAEPSPTLAAREPTGRGRQHPENAGLATRDAAERWVRLV